jgi:hypothetical protein
MATSRHFANGVGGRHVLVAKGVNSPLAAYGPICRHFVRVNTRRSRRPIWEFSTTGTDGPRCIHSNRK